MSVKLVYFVLYLRNVLCHVHNYVGSRRKQNLPLSTASSQAKLTSTLSLSHTHTQAKTYIESMPTFPKKDYTKFFIGANPKAVDVLDRLLVMDPDRRASAAELLEHPYFANYADPEDEVGGA